MIALLVLMGCGPTCQSTCNHVYRTCGIEKTGQTEAELVRTCERECEAALRQSGDLDGYEPDRIRNVAESIVLENETQAAAWMDCVWDHAPNGSAEECEELDPRSGYCAPI